MEPVVRVETGHSDLIHDVAFDWYGRRMATCGSDHMVRVWDRDERTDSWVQTSEFKVSVLTTVCYRPFHPLHLDPCNLVAWQAHSGSVWKVSWAHPEFGQVLATCSFDHTCRIWEEQGMVECIGRGNSQTENVDGVYRPVLIYHDRLLAFRGEIVRRRWSKLHMGSSW